MPLTGSDAALKAALKAACIGDPATGMLDNAATDAFLAHVAAVLVSHIVANAVVTGTCTVTTTGTATAQAGGGPVTGTVG